MFPTVVSFRRICEHKVLQQQRIEVSNSIGYF